VDRDDRDEWLLEIVKRQFRYFGPYPEKIAEIYTPESVQSIIWLFKEIPQDKMTPFAWTTEREVIKKDKDFIGKMMKLDWRDRPTAKELLEDEWWNDEE
jgi:serine/threonine protein kinase